MVLGSLGCVVFFIALGGLMLKVFITAPGVIAEIAEAGAREQTKEKTWEQEVKETKWARRAIEDIHYFYDAEVGICYAAVVYHIYHNGHSRAIGLTVVPYEKVKDRAFVIGTPKDQTPEDQKRHP